MPWCSPALNGITRTEHGGQPTEFYQPFQLAHHHFLTPDRAVQDGLVEHYLEHRRIGDPSEQRLPSDANVNPLFDLGVIHAWLVGSDHRARIVLGLEKAWYQL